MQSFHDQLILLYVDVVYVKASKTNELTNECSVENFDDLCSKLLYFLLLPINVKLYSYL